MELPASIESAILGLVQGLTEFLPISSSGHLIAGKEILGSEATLAFDVALHVATLAAVVIYFRRDLVDLTQHPKRWKLLGLLIMATVPGATLGVVLGDWREGIGPWFAVYGWFFSALYLLASRGQGGTLHYTDLGPWRALAVGCAQALAIFPGVSRSGLSIVAGLWLGLERESAARFSFILSIPLIAGAGLKSGIKINAEAIAAAGGVPAILIGMAVAFVVGVFAIHLLLRIVRSQGFANFGWYNLLVAIAFGAYLLFRNIPLLNRVPVMRLVMQRLLAAISRGLPVWVLLGAVLAYLRPEAFQWTAWKIFDQRFFTWMFAITMFAVGTVIDPRHFGAVIRNPVSVTLGLLTQFTVMPLCAWLVARVAGFSDALTLGFILVGCAPGAMTSNVLTYLARGDTAFSVTLTTMASLLAVVVTPLLVELLAGETLGMTPEKFWQQLWTIAWTVAIPVVLGLLLRIVLPVGRKLYAMTSPAIASIAIVIICCHVIQSNSARLAELDVNVLLCVVIINAAGFAAGYGLAIAYRFSRERRITLCIEIGMQNAGMGVVLASTTFGDRPEVALPAALFAIWCVLTAAVLIEILKSGRQPGDQ